MRRIIQRFLYKIVAIQTVINFGKKEFLYVLLMGGAAVIGFSKTMVFGVYLSPEDLGYYSIVFTIAGYGAFLQFGLMSGLNRELPVSLGSKKEAYSAGLVGETTLSVVGLQLFGILIYYLIIANITFTDPLMSATFYLAGPVVFSTSLGQMVLLRLRAEQRILHFSLIQLIISSCMLLLGIVGIQFIGYKGAVLAAVIVNLLAFIIVSKMVLGPVNYAWFHIKDLLYLMRIGLPMMIAGVLLILQLSMDRLFLIRNVSASQIGIYQIGMLPLMLGIVGSGIVSQYISPKLLFSHGEGKSLGYVFFRSLLVAGIIIIGMLLLWPLVPLVAAFVINLWLPEYRGSLPLVGIFYLGAPFVVANITGIVINAANQQILALYQTLAMVVIAFIGYSIITYYNMALKWYAYMNVTLQVLGFFLITAVSYYVVQKSVPIKAC